MLSIVRPLALRNAKDPVHLSDLAFVLCGFPCVAGFREGLVRLAGLELVDGRVIPFRALEDDDHAVALHRDRFAAAAGALKVLGASDLALFLRGKIFAAVAHALCSVAKSVTAFMLP